MFSYQQGHGKQHTGPTKAARMYDNDSTPTSDLQWVDYLESGIDND